MLCKENVERNNEMARLRNVELLTLAEIAKKYGISRQRVEEILRRKDVRTSEEIRAERLQRLSTVLNDSVFLGMTNEEVGKMVNLSASKVQKYRTYVPAADHFWDYVDRRGDDECWNWLASFHPRGYGNIRFNNKREYSHRVAWILTYGEIPIDKFVHHSCSNLSCCNPKHLYLKDTKR